MDLVAFSPSDGRRRRNLVYKHDSPRRRRVAHEIVAIRRHHVRAHSLGADEVKGVGQRLPHVPQVAHHLRLPLDDRPNRNAALDHGHTSVLSRTTTETRRGKEGEARECYNSVLIDTGYVLVQAQKQ